MKTFNLLAYLLNLGKKEYIRKNYSLENVKLALKYLSNPEQRIQNIIHITGTNGKGTVAIYTAKILNALGYDVGLFISPHIFNVTERIQLNGKEIDGKLLNNYLLKIKESLPTTLFFDLTYFELLTCVMFLYFADVQPDYVILEVGLGGKLDATNVIEHSLVSCITSISLDHTEVLGETKLKILKDKAGIVKPNSTLVCGELEPYLKNFLVKLCEKLNTKFVYVYKDLVKYTVDFNNWSTSCRLSFLDKTVCFIIKGISIVQPYNLLLSTTIVENVIKNKTLARRNLHNVVQTLKCTVIPCRMQQFKLNNMEVIIDGAHNSAAIENFVSTIKRSNFKDFVLCLTLMKEKKYDRIIKKLAMLNDRIKEVVVFKLPLSRAQKLSVLYNTSKRYFKVKISKFSNINSLLKYLSKFDTFSKVFFVGSFYTASFLPLSKSEHCE